MLADFAVLHVEISGFARSTAPQPLSLDVGKSIADRVEQFFTLFLTPIVGP